MEDGFEDDAWGEGLDIAGTLTTGLSLKYDAADGSAENCMTSAKIGGTAPP